MQNTKEVLVVDDCPEDTYLLFHALKECGIKKISSVTSGEEAAKYIAGLVPFQFRPEPDLIFVDMKMGKIDGLDFIRWVQRNPILNKIPIVILSGSTPPGQEAEMIKAGAKAFYKKPLEVEHLVKIVTEVLQKYLTE